MGRYSTWPTLFDDLKSVDINYLRRHGYLENSMSGILTWSRNGMKTGSIRLHSHINGHNKRIILSYNCDGEEIKDTYHLTFLTSNLGKGKVWYFVCNYTSSRCFKLHLISGHFVHRSAFQTAMYESQTQSKKWRWMERTYGAYFDSEELYRELYKKHFKKYYNGMPTKRYLKIINRLNRSESFSVDEIQQLYLIK